MPRPDFPEGLFISVSQLKTFLVCPRRYELHYVRGEPAAFVPVALAFGTAVHRALAAFYSEKKLTGDSLPLDAVHEVFRAAWQEAVDGPVPLQADEEGEDDTGAIVDKGVAMLATWHAHALRRESTVVEAVEKSFAVKLIDPDAGEELDEQLVGTIDLIERDASGGAVVVEHKSAIRKYSKDQLRYDIQPTAYKLAARAMGLGEVGLVYQVLLKTRAGGVQYETIMRGAGDELDFLRIVVGVLKAIDAGVSYPVRGWQCRTCAWAYACR